MALLKNKKNNIYKDNKDYSELKKELMRNKDNISLEIMSLTTGEVFYKDTKTKEEYLWVDSDFKVVPLDVVFSMLSNSKKMFYGLSLGITSVYSNDVYVEFSLEDVINGLGLNEVYKPFDYDVSNIDGIILDSPLEEFTELCNNCSKDVIMLITERAIYLSKEGYLKDPYKEQILTSETGLTHIFEHR